ncbi:hypothetical protein KCP71_14015 [Salmonella enterica subsp. enterica]|nr:hypothetical protein KCP71_14015 [Salmonella enterica subsp. enterica]
MLITCACRELPGGWRHRAYGFAAVCGWWPGQGALNASGGNARTTCQNSLSSDHEG